MVTRKLFHFAHSELARWRWLSLCALLLLAACTLPVEMTGTRVAVAVQSAPLAGQRPACSGRFVAHDLPHVTTTADGVIRMYQANGAGVAIHDLDNDGDLDLVLGNYDGPNSILWNQGGLRLRKEEMPIGRTRAVTAVDVDGDGWPDLVLTRVGGAVNLWRNRGAAVPADGEGRFEPAFLPGFGQPAYALDWADLDGDGDLDGVTASYDIGLLTERGDEYLLNGEGGVYVHWNEDGHFRAERLTAEAQALAIALGDVNGDGRPDLLVGNDFAVRDAVWLNTPSGWTPAAPFPETTHSTMSYDLGDVDNQGRLSLFATDMKPYSQDPAVLAAWAPLMEMPQEMQPDDPQRMENVLLVPDRWGAFHNQARARRVDATGWSWSSLFGDLDQDGWLDLYAVNGFAEAETFAHLPRHELVEANQVLRNRGRGRFERRPDWGLGSTRGGRGAAMGDLDGDGDLDVVVNNLRGAAQLFENRLCGGDALLVDLRWPGRGNTQAVGATVFLETSVGRLRRDVRVTRGYLSGDAGRLHFGFPADAELRRLTVRWPDGAVSVVTRPRRNVRMTVERR